MSELIRDAQLAVLPGTTHMGIMHSPDRFARPRRPLPRRGLIVAASRTRTHRGPARHTRLWLDATRRTIGDREAG